MKRSLEEMSQSLPASATPSSTPVPAPALCSASDFETSTGASSIIGVVVRVAPIERTRGTDFMMLLHLVDERTPVMPPGSSHDLVVKLFAFPDTLLPHMLERGHVIVCSGRVLPLPRLLHLSRLTFLVVCAAQSSVVARRRL